MSRLISSMAFFIGIEKELCVHIKGTPTFFVNGVRYEDSWDLDTFS
jgi:protein-disulfide isomerase